MISRFILFVTSFFICIQHKSSVYVASELTGLIVIPGLGRADRLINVVSNIRKLEPFLDSSLATSWDCIVYIYALRFETSFWEMEHELNYLKKFCSIIENPGGKVTENMFWVQPALLRNKYKKVFFLLDDCKLESTNSKGIFPLDGLLLVMTRNNLTVVSPMVM